MWWLRGARGGRGCCGPRGYFFRHQNQGWIDSSPGSLSLSSFSKWLRTPGAHITHLQTLSVDSHYPREHCVVLWGSTSLQAPCLSDASLSLHFLGLSLMLFISYILWVKNRAWTSCRCGIFWCWENNNVFKYIMWRNTKGLQTPLCFLLSLHVSCFLSLFLSLSPQPVKGDGCPPRIRVWLKFPPP